MDNQAKKKSQKSERDASLERILKSSAPYKIIAAGPGTGKTFTFGKLLAKRKNNNNLAVTFINKLADEMKLALSHLAEVKTFHSFCKKILHQQNGRLEVAPFLPAVVEVDAALIGNGLHDFVQAMQALAKKPKTIGFYLDRGDYYDAIGFDDAIYRLLRQVERKPDQLPQFGQIVVDEFQDFNPMEVRFIELLATKADLLIVGDDDQAVYDGRNASPDHLRRLHRSKEYEKFDLEFCSRCTEPVVAATNALIARAVKNGHFKDRIEKKYECYLEAKEPDSQRYPKLVTGCCTTAKVIPKYIRSEIDSIPDEDIVESRDPKGPYPTVLVIGQKQYLAEIAKQLAPYFPQLEYSPRKEGDWNLADAYEWLAKNQDSNLAWRLILEACASQSHLKEAVVASQDGTPMVELVDAGLRTTHIEVLTRLLALQSGEKLSKEDTRELTKALGKGSGMVFERFAPQETIAKVELEKTKPTIKLTSFVGAKGLSAGHVFVVGVHAGSMPRDPSAIRDTEVSQFLVALTRTRKCCHIVSNKWLVSPKDSKGTYINPFPPSPFLGWIGKSHLEDRGDLKAADFS